MSSLILALDFGGTKLTAAACTPHQPTMWLHRQQRPSPADAREQYELMCALVSEILAETAAKPQAIGVSFGGPVDRTRQTVKLSYHNVGWADVPLVAWLQTEFAVPVTLDNDANAGALGEFRFGAGRGCQDMLYVTVSTGIGGGWILGGQLYRGAHGLAGEIGHTRIKPELGGLPWDCGDQHCLEAEASGLAIAHRAQHYLAQNPHEGARLRQLCAGDADRITAAMVSQAAASGDGLSQTVLRVSARQLGRGLAQAATLLNPQRILLGGGVSKAGEVWWQAVRETTRANVPPTIPLDLAPAALGDDAPLWGAVALCITETP